MLLESNSAQALLALTNVGQGIAILPSTVKLENIGQKVVPVWHQQKPIGMWMSAIWDPRRYLSPAGKIFIEEAYRFTRKEFPGQNVSVVAAIPNSRGIIGRDGLERPAARRLNTSPYMMVRRES